MDSRVTTWGAIALAGAAAVGLYLRSRRQRCAHGPAGARSEAVVVSPSKAARAPTGGVTLTPEQATKLLGGDHPLTPADDELIAWCYRIRDGMRPPAHSNFRVVAILTVTVPDEDSTDSNAVALRHVVGTNHEIGIIGGSICAERTALGKLQLMDYKDLVAVHIVTDAPEPITPGTLCRQYMSEVGRPDTRIVVHADSGCIVTELRRLHPLPYVYAGHAREGVLAAAEAFASRAEGVVRRTPAGAVGISPVMNETLGKAGYALYREALACTGLDDRDVLHPVRFAGAALFSDGTTEVAAQSKALEYGATLGVFAKLLHTLQSRVARGARLQLLLKVDQFGVLHAPSGQGRALLAEHGFREAPLVAHDQDGRLVKVVVADLLPMTPAIESVLSSL